MSSNNKKTASGLAGLGALTGLVYSTDSGRTCPECRQAKADCRCGRPVLPKGDGIVRVSRETKGRAGKGVTLVKGVPLDEAGLIALGKELKAACGSGGTVKERRHRSAGRPPRAGDRVAEEKGQLDGQAGRRLRPRFLSPGPVWL